MYRWTAPTMHRKSRATTSCVRIPLWSAAAQASAVVVVRVARHDVHKVVGPNLDVAKARNERLAIGYRWGLSSGTILQSA